MPGSGRTSPSTKAFVERFGPLHADVAARVTPSSVTLQAATLAAIIVLDQFSRNMYRASARAFAFDPAALAIARAAVDSGLDRSLGLEQRVFMYMPFQHSEDRAMQARSIELLQPVGDPNYLNYAQQHRDIIERFGRFPHRNKLLGRESTSRRARLPAGAPGILSSAGDGRRATAGAGLPRGNGGSPLPKSLALAVSP